MVGHSSAACQYPGMEQTPFNLLRQNASKWFQYLPDIQKLRNKFSYFDKCRWGEGEYEDEVDEDEDEDVKQEKRQRLKHMKKEKQLALQKAERMMKIMGEIAVDIGNPYVTELMQGFYYDIETQKGTTCRRTDGSRFYVEKVEHLSDAQKKLSPFAYAIAHPSPEELGTTS